MFLFASYCTYTFLSACSRVLYISTDEAVWQAELNMNWAKSPPETTAAGGAEHELGEISARETGYERSSAPFSRILRPKLRLRTEQILMATNALPKSKFDPANRISISRNMAPSTNGNFKHIPKGSALSSVSPNTEKFHAVIEFSSNRPMRGISKLGFYE